MTPAPSVTPLPQVVAKTEVIAKPTIGQKLTAGDPVFLKVSPPPGTEDATPELAVKLKDGPVELGQGRLLWVKPTENHEFLAELTSYKPGSFDIPPIVFEKNGKAVFATEPEHVEYVAVGTGQEKDDIYPPLGVGFPPWVVALGAVFLLAAIGGSIWALARWTQRRKKEREALAAIPVPLNPREEFEKTRRIILEKAYLDKKQFKPHYFAFSDAAKRFLGRAYQFDAEESTTRELIGQLESRGTGKNLLKDWTEIFNEMDVTKFTDENPQIEAATSLADRLSELVKISVPPGGAPI